jgi:hypothetical protein
MTSRSIFVTRCLGASGGGFGEPAFDRALRAPASGEVELG